VIEALHIEEDFAPNGSGADDLAEIDFRVNKGPEKLDVDVLNSHGELIQRLADDQVAADDQVVELAWNGLDADGERAPTGLYSLRIRLLDRGRTITPRQEISLEDEAD
jgi:flagellar hook capping protein FlgD